MSALAFYTDTHVDKQVVLQLRQRGVDALRCHEVGLSEADDETHLRYASEQDRILITFDKGLRDRAFRWLATGRSHAGVFVCKHILQSEAGIGIIVMTCLFYDEAVREGAASLDDFHNQVFDIE